MSLTGLGMAGWMCYSSQPFTCNPNQGCPNNSAAEGQQLYQWFNSGNQPLAYLVTGIQQCDKAEGVAKGIDPDQQYGGQMGSGQTAIEAHMTSNCKAAH